MLRDNLNYSLKFRIATKKESLLKFTRLLSSFGISTRLLIPISKNSKFTDQAAGLDFFGIFRNLKTAKFNTGWKKGQSADKKLTLHDGQSINKS